MKRGGNLLIPYASVTKIQQEQIERAGKWPEYTPVEPEALNDEVSEWAIKYCKRMRDIHDKQEIVTDNYMPSELAKKSHVAKKGTTILSSNDEEEEEIEAEPAVSDHNTEEEDNDYIADYFDEEADAFGNE